MQLNVTTYERQLILTALESYAVLLRDGAAKSAKAGDIKAVESLCKEAGECYDLCRKLHTQK